MKGNAIRQGQQRTRELNPHSVAGGTGSGRVDESVGSIQQQIAAHDRLVAFKQRPQTKGQARQARRVKDYEQTFTETNARGRCTSSGKHHDVHRPGSMSK